MKRIDIQGDSVPTFQVTNITRSVVIDDKCQEDNMIVYRFNDEEETQYTIEIPIYSLLEALETGIITGYKDKSYKKES